MTPTISVIIPYYNGARFIGQAMASLRAQNYPALEIIIVDDGSDAANAAALQAFVSEATILRQENKGPAAARNLALGRAKGEFIAFLDSDDKWPEGKIALHLNAFDADPSLELVGGRVKYEWQDGIEDRPVVLDENNSMAHVHLGAVMARRGVFGKTGAFDGALRFSEDHDWWLRVREKNIKAVILPEATLLYRRHEGNMTRGKELKDFNMLEVLKRSIDRRRGGAKSGKAEELAAFTSHIKG